MTTSLDPGTPPVDLDLEGLRRAVRGEVIAPGDPAWDAARMPWNVRIEQRPAAVVRALGADDVAAAVRAAAEAGVRLAMQSSGHGCVHEAAGALLVRTDAMDEVSLDPRGRTVRVGPAARWSQVHARSARHGLAGLSGYAATPAVAGYTLGGGFGWLGRRHGFAANSVRAVDMVDADGRRVRVDAGTDPELFWAVRGGGGSFGAVTALELDLFEAPRLFAGRRFWPIEHAEEVARTWRDWAAEAPDTVGSALAIFRFPPLEMVPEPVRGRQLVSVTACVMGDEEEARARLAGLSGLPAPYIDTFAPIDATGLGHVNQDPEEPIPARGQGMTLRDLPDAALDGLLAQVGPGVESPILLAELRHLGGAVGRPGTDDGAVGHLDERFLLYALGVVPAPELEPAVAGALGALGGALAPHAGARGIYNFLPDDADASAAFPAETYRRLRAVRARVDPDELFLANFPIPAA